MLTLFPKRIAITLTIATLALAAAGPRASAQQLPHVHAAGQLGSVSFEISCKPPVQADFNRAVGLLHSFWYDEAERLFKQVSAADPDCAMAYWGEAIAGFPQINGWPQPAQVAAAQRALAIADKALEKTPREAAYIRALHVFYDDYKTQDVLDHARHYADSMRAVAASYRGDLEAQVFYALALLAPDSQDDIALVAQRKAVAILYPLFRKHPNHPGIAHYIIHASDNPGMAPAGLEAARRYATIAPASPHALHMPGHIFARLGLWQDDIRSNLASKAAAEDTSGMHIGAENRLHAMEFLEYAYLQVGQDDDARAILAEARTIKSSDVDPRYPTYFGFVQARFVALFAIETRNWEMAAGLQPLADVPASTQVAVLLANAIAAGHRRDFQAADRAGRSVDALMENLAALRPGSEAATPHDEIHAWAAFARGDLKSAVALLRTIAERQEKTGKGEVELPAREMLAEMYLLEGNATEALREYQASLNSDPNRFTALLGAAKAAELLGKRAVAARYYRTLVGNCAGAKGPVREDLKNARAAIGAQ